MSKNKEEINDVEEKKGWVSRRKNKEKQEKGEERNNEKAK